MAILPRMTCFQIFLGAASPALAWSWYSSSFIGKQSSLRPRPQYHSQNNLRMGMQVKIRIVGRRSGSEKWLEDAYNMYATRLRASPLEVETVWHKTDQDLIKGVQGDLDKNHVVVLLDPKGKQRTSEMFGEEIFSWLNRGGSRLAFVIGGAEGLPQELKEQSLEMMSLSDMTFTHQFARTMLTEQIYRATEIRKGSGYHK